MKRLLKINLENALSKLEEVDECLGRALDVDQMDKTKETADGKLTALYAQEILVALLDALENGL